MGRAALAFWLGLIAAPALAQERVVVRTGDHPTHGRIVFDWASPPAYQVEQQGERVILRFPNADAIDLAGARRLPRNILAVAKVPGGVELTLRSGARLRHFRSGPKVAVDAMNPPEGDQAEARPQTAAAPASPSREAARSPAAPRRAEPPAQIAAAAPTPANPTPTVAAAAAPPPPALPPRSAPEPLRAEAPASSPSIAAPPLREVTIPPRDVAPTPREVIAAPASFTREAERAPPPRPPMAQPTLMSLAGPPPIRARLVEDAALGTAMRLGLGAGAGAVALRRGEQALLLVETERPIEFGALLREPGFAGIQARGVPGGTLITWPLAAGAQLALRQEGNDWFVAAVPRQHPSATAIPPLRAEQDQGRTILHAARPTRVVTLPDPLTGGPLLLGLVAQAQPRQIVTRSMAEFELLETFLGVAILARADRVALRPGAERFLLSIEGGSVSLAGGPGEGQLAALGMTRSFDMPAQPVAGLLERLRAQQSDIASAAPLTRLEPRLAAAQTLLALGLPQEAQAMLRIGAQESPAAAQDSRQAFLSGMAALLAGRPGEAIGLEAEMPPSDEVILWRGLRAAMQGDAPAAAPALAATWPLLHAYPDGLRRRLIGPAAEALVEGGQLGAGRRLIDAAGEESATLLAQALLEEAAGEPVRALEAYATAGNARDRLMRARALRRGIELRLATGRLDAAGAARALEQALFAWRGDGVEISTRERIAALRREAGDPRAALNMLRETEALFPEQAGSLRAPIQQAFMHALEADPPLGAVTLYDAHPELLPQGDAGEAILALLTERLTALDLADRAAGLLRRAMERAPAGEQRAALGARLAAQRLSERDVEGALSALSASSAPRLPPALVEARSVLAARAEARRGNRALAAEALQALGPAGDETLAEILTEARDFAGAAAALGRQLAAETRGAGPLPEAQQRAVLRQAALLAMAGDEAGLAQHRARFVARLTPGDIATAFEALTTDPVRGLADLPRLARELNLFRGFPQRLEPLRTAQRPAG